MNGRPPPKRADAGAARLAGDGNLSDDYALVRAAVVGARVAVQRAEREVRKDMLTSPHAPIAVAQLERAMDAIGKVDDAARTIDEAGQRQAELHMSLMQEMERLCPECTAQLHDAVEGI